MSLLQLYLDRNYHKVVLVSQSCKTFVDFLCLCLSLAGLGRIRGAVTLLHIRLEEETDPSNKLLLLRCIDALAQEPHTLTEIKYWESLSICSGSDPVWYSLLPIPLGEAARASVQVSCFVRHHAFIHPESFSDSVLADARLSRATKDTADFSIVEVVEKCGSIHAIAERLKHIPSAQSEHTVTERPEILAQVLEHGYLESLRRKMAAVACAYIQGNLNQALEDSLLCIKEMTDMRQLVSAPSLRGLSDYDIQTLCMICSQCVTRNTPDRILDYLLRQLLDPGEVVSVGDYEYSRKEMHSPFQASQMRRSSFFMSCGHIFRARAYRTSRPLAPTLGSSEAEVYVVDRSEGLEMARKYVIAAALQPSDHPSLHELYDQVIQSLLLCGRICLRVLWFFFGLRNHFYRSTFFAFAEPCKSFASNSIGTHVQNMPEVYERFYDICQASSTEEQFEYNLSPMLVEVKGKLLILSSHDKLMSLSFHRQGDSVASAIESLTVDESEICKESSRQLVHLWVDVYNEVREVPMEAETLLSEFQ